VSEMRAVVMVVVVVLAGGAETAMVNQNSVFF
jgi:hypothetical protein